MATFRIVMETLGFVVFLGMLTIACLPSAAIRQLVKRITRKP
ncbi:hypothetical protein [Acidipila sp. EB88]|nr:hypothetical protein [Acidipila sp. EB88]